VETLQNTVYFEALTLDQHSGHEEREFGMQMAKINSEMIKFKLDTGAQSDVIPYDVICRIKCAHLLKPCKLRIISYGSFTLKPLGEITLQTTIEDKTYPLKFVVVKSGCSPLLSLESAVR